MSRLMTLQEMFKRYRRPGDVVFALLFLLFSLFLMFNLGSELKWKDGLALGKQPAFWPTVAVIGMVVFSALHWLSSALSPRIPGRLQEVKFWLKSVEYVAWFLTYMFLVEQIGYLISTIILTSTLTFRVGFKNWRTILVMVVFAIAVVLIFKSFLQVKIPGGVIYEFLPDSIRSIALTYL